MLKSQSMEGGCGDDLEWPGFTMTDNIDMLHQTSKSASRSCSTDVTGIFTITLDLYQYRFFSSSKGQAWRGSVFTVGSRGREDLHPLRDTYISNSLRVIKAISFTEYHGRSSGADSRKRGGFARWWLWRSHFSLNWSGRRGSFASQLVILIRNRRLGMGTDEGIILWRIRGHMPSCI